jgi:hypothetical protein
MRTKPQKPRLSLDAHGRPIAEVEISKGIFDRMVDTSKVRTLKGHELKLTETVKVRRPDFNPYDGDGANKALKKRNGTDYLRALSEEIKRRRKTGV